jgi:hypothetical protein
VGKARPAKTWAAADGTRDGEYAAVRRFSDSGTWLAELPSWTFSFERGLPTKETVGLMYDALDFQRAVEGYIWATPMVHFDEWRRQMKEQGEA